VSCNWDSSRGTNLTIRVPRSNTPPTFLFNASHAVSFAPHAVGGEEHDVRGVTVGVQDGNGSHAVEAVSTRLDQH